MIPNSVGDYNFSIGTRPIMDTLLSVINYTNPPDTIVINVETIIRNCMSKNYNQNPDSEERVQANVDDLVKFANIEILNMLNELVDMFSSNLSRIINPTIIVYLGKYNKHIPINQQRKLNATKSLVYQAAQIIEKSVLSRIEECNRGVKIIQLPETSELPYKTLGKEISKLTNQHRTVLISHHPLDYYLYLFCSDMFIIHSFTGNISRQDKFNKLVFINYLLPFYPSIHAILGDNIDMSSSLSLKDKRALCKKAEEESWITMDEKQVLNRLYELGIRIPFSI